LDQPVLAIAVNDLEQVFVLEKLVLLQLVQELALTQLVQKLQRVLVLQLAQHLRPLALVELLHVAPLQLVHSLGMKNYLQGYMF
jgi:hypothetical protein